MWRKVFHAVLCWLALSQTSGEAVKPVLSSLVNDNVSADSAPRLYRNVPVGVYAAPYAAYSFHVPFIAAPKPAASRIVPVINNANGYLRDSYGNRFVETPQAAAYKTAFPQQFLPLQELPAHLAQPLVASASQAKQTAPHYFVGSQYRVPTYQVTQSAEHHPTQGFTGFSAPVVYAHNLRGLSLPAAVPTHTQAITAQQQPSNSKVVYSNAQPAQQYNNEVKFQRLEQQPAGNTAQGHEQKAQIQTAPATITAVVNGKKTVVNIETKPPVPLLDLSLLEPLTFANPLVPQVQHFLPRINDATYHKLPEFNANQAKNNKKEFVITKTHSYDSGNVKAKAPPKKKSKQPKVEVNYDHDVPQKVYPAKKPTVTIKGTPELNESPEITYEINAPNYKETYKEKSVTYNKDSGDEPITYSYDEKIQSAPITYSYTKTEQKKPVNYNIVTSKDPAQIQHVITYQGDGHQPEQLIYTFKPEEQNRNQHNHQGKSAEQAGSAESSSEESDDGGPPPAQQSYPYHPESHHQPQNHHRPLSHHHSQSHHNPQSRHHPQSHNRPQGQQHSHQNNHPHPPSHSSGEYHDQPKHSYNERPHGEHHNSYNPHQNEEIHYEEVPYTSSDEVEHRSHQNDHQRPNEHTHYRPSDNGRHKQGKQLHHKQNFAPHYHSQDVKVPIHAAQYPVTQEYEENIKIVPSDAPSANLKGTPDKGENDESYHNFYQAPLSSLEQYKTFIDQQMKSQAQRKPHTQTSPAPVIHEQAKRIIIQEESPEEMSVHQEQNIMAQMIDDDGNDEEDFEKAYKDAAFGFQAYDAKSDDAVRDIHNPANYGFSRENDDYNIEKSPFQEYQDQGDSFPKSTRSNYKDARDNNKEDYYSEYNVNQPESMAQFYQDKANYYKLYKKFRPQKYFAEENDKKKEKYSGKYTVAPAFEFNPVPEKKANYFAQYKAEPIKYEYTFSKEPRDRDNSAHASRPYQRYKSKTNFVEPQFQYGFEPIAIPRLLDSELAAMASNDSPESEKPGTRKKIYKENWYIKKTSTSGGKPS